MELDRNFEDSLVGLVCAALRKDIEDVDECTAYIARRLEGYGVQACADKLRWLLYRSESIDGVPPAGRWQDEWRYLDDDDLLYTVYETEQVVESRDVSEPPSILTPEQRTMVKEVSRVARSRMQQGKPLPTCMFTYGTAIQEPFDLALHIAGELEVECFLIEFTNEDESRACRWSGQLYRLCEFAAELPCVLVLRKVERICNLAFSRDSWRIEQLKCVREEFLNDLLRLEAPTVVVACTNVEMKLDAGEWERFGYRMELNVAEPDPGLMVFRSVALGDPEGLRKAVAALRAKD